MLVLVGIFPGTIALLFVCSMVIWAFGIFLSYSNPDKIPTLTIVMQWVALVLPCELLGAYLFYELYNKTDLHSREELAVMMLFLTCNTHALGWFGARHITWWPIWVEVEIEQTITENKKSVHACKPRRSPRLARQ